MRRDCDRRGPGDDFRLFGSLWVMVVDDGAGNVGDPRAALDQHEEELVFLAASDLTPRPRVSRNRSPRSKAGRFTTMFDPRPEPAEVGALEPPGIAAVDGESLLAEVATASAVLVSHRQDTAR